jgi:exopolysaccharide biosynthesis predicted pyruvyltransferase EpsI
MTRTTTTTTSRPPRTGGRVRLLALFVSGCLFTSTLSVFVARYIKTQFQQVALRVAQERSTNAAAAGGSSSSTRNHFSSRQKQLRRKRTSPHTLSLNDIPLQNNNAFQPAVRKPDDDDVLLEKDNERTNKKKKMKLVKNWLDPKLSHPPEAMSLTDILRKDQSSSDASSSDWQRHRYMCLQHIRDWQAGRQVPPTSSSDDASSLRLLPMWLYGDGDQDIDEEAATPATSTTQHILLVDPAYHANVGDHMITVGEQVYIQQKRREPSNKTVLWQECSFFQAGPWAPSCDKVIPTLSSSAAAATSSALDVDRKDKKTKKLLLALWHGGGNWGDLWDTIHAVRTSSLRTLLHYNFTIVGMPQSLYFDSDKAERLNVNDIRQAIVAGLGLHGSAATDDSQLQQALQGRFLLTWREQASLHRARLLYPYIQHALMPDIAFQLGPFNAPAVRAKALEDSPSPPRVDVLFLLRDDHESLYQPVRDRKSIRGLLSCNPQTARFTYSVVDWSDRLDRFGTQDYYFTETAIQLLDMGHVVICDRLHAAILAYLSGIPFVFVDQVSGKITKTFGVAMQAHDDCQKPALYERAENMVDAIEKAASLWQKVHAQSS